MKLILILNDQGGSEVDRITYDVTHTLRESSPGHPPVVLLEYEQDGETKQNKAE